MWGKTLLMASLLALGIYGGVLYGEVHAGAVAFAHGAAAQTMGSGPAQAWSGMTQMMNGQDMTQMMNGHDAAQMQQECQQMQQGH